MKLKYLRKKRDRHGVARYFFRYRGKSWALPFPVDPKFMSAYEAHLNRVNEGEVQFARVSFIKGSLGWSIEQYLGSDEWRGRSPVTREKQRFVLDHLKQVYGAGLWKDLTPHDVKAIRIKITKAFSVPTAKVALGLISTLWKFTDDHFDIGGLDANPTAGVRRLYKTKKGHEPWPSHVMEAFDNAAPPHLLLARKLALYTGQRRSDIAIMDWSQFDGTTISVRQQKTGALLAIPCHPVLCEALEAVDARDRTGPILRNRGGERYTPNGLARAFRTVFEQLDIRGYPLHGLRKLAADRLAEAGCTDREIMAVIGHRTTLVPVAGGDDQPAVFARRCGVSRMV